MSNGTPATRTRTTRHGKSAEGKVRIPVTCWSQEAAEIRQAAEVADESVSQYLTTAGLERARARPAGDGATTRITRIREIMDLIDGVAGRRADGNPSNVEPADIAKIVTLEHKGRILRTEDAADLLDYLRAAIPEVAT